MCIAVVGHRSSVMGYIQVQSETVGKTLKVKLNNSTITVLSKIFNLQPEMFYLIGEDNVVMPDPEMMLINEEDILSYVIYEVHGEQLGRKTEAMEKAAIGNRFSYQSPFVGAGPRGTSLKRNKKHSLPSRPVFTFNKARKEPENIQKWHKNIIFSEVLDGKPSPIYQIYLTLTPQTASMDQVARIVEEEVGTRVMLLDNKGLRIMPPESTKGETN